MLTTNEMLAVKALKEVCHNMGHSCAYSISFVATYMPDGYSGDPKKDFLSLHDEGWVTVYDEDSDDPGVSLTYGVFGDAF